jgi:hypothetical protein
VAVAELAELWRSAYQRPADELANPRRLILRGKMGKKGLKMVKIDIKMVKNGLKTVKNG